MYVCLPVSMSVYVYVPTSMSVSVRLCICDMGFLSSCSCGFCVHRDVKMEGKLTSSAYGVFTLGGTTGRRRDWNVAGGACDGSEGCKD